MKTALEMLNDLRAAEEAQAAFHKGDTANQYGKALDHACAVHDAREAFVEAYGTDEDKEAERRRPEFLAAAIRATR